LRFSSRMCSLASFFSAPSLFEQYNMAARTP
jgi:hypothetical protein